MTERIKFIEINYHQHDEFTTPGEAIRKHAPSNLILHSLSSHADITLIKHLNYEGEEREGRVRYRFFKRKNSFFRSPRHTHQFIRQENPDIVLVQGFIFPIPVYLLRKNIGPHAKILLQHHGEIPFKRKRIFQRLMAKQVDGWLFSSPENADEWIRAGIASREKCFAIPSATTNFTRLDKEICKYTLGMGEELIFIWVGRLNKNKDPFTVLDAFDKFLQTGTRAKLYMIYTEPELEREVEERIKKSQLLREHVIMIGRLPYPELEKWYSAADYLVSGSHREGGSYAIMEAMACGCVPIVTNIPASMHMIGKGNAGYYYKAGDSHALFELLSGLTQKDRENFSRKAQQYFERNMSPGAIAEQLLKISRSLLAK